MLKQKKRLLGLITSVFSLSVFLGSGVIKKVLHNTKIRKKKHNKLLYLAKNKLVKKLLIKSLVMMNLNQ